jgi:hypothetical protein
MALGYWQVKRTAENCIVGCEQKNGVGNCNLECKQTMKLKLVVGSNLVPSNFLLINLNFKNSKPWK